MTKDALTKTARLHSYDGDIVGCGKTFTQQPDEEGIFDCPHCGIFFNRESLTG